VARSAMRSARLPMRRPNSLSRRRGGDRGGATPSGRLKTSAIPVHPPPHASKNRRRNTPSRPGFLLCMGLFLQKSLAQEKLPACGGGVGEAAEGSGKGPCRSRMPPPHLTRTRARASAARGRARVGLAPPRRFPQNQRYDPSALGRGRRAARSGAAGEPGAPQGPSASAPGG
jgi:hypothetical protein